MTTLNKDLLPTVAFLDSLHYGIATADDPGNLMAGNLNRYEAEALANEYTDETGIQFVVVDTNTGEIAS